MKSLKGSHRVLSSLLLLINGLESEEAPTHADYARALLGEIVKDIAFTYSDAKDLRSFDRVFEVCGWDSQGIRYCRNEAESIRGRLVMEPRIVELTDEKRTVWAPI